MLITFQRLGCVVLTLLAGACVQEQMVRARRQREAEELKKRLAASGMTPGDHNRFKRAKSRKDEETRKMDIERMSKPKVQRPPSYQCLSCLCFSLFSL